MTDSQKWFWIASALVLAGLVYLLSPILTPFVMAALLAYLGDPLVDRLVSWKVPRALASVIVLVILGLVVILIPLLILPILQKQVSALIQMLPGFIDWVSGIALPWVEEQLGIDPSVLDVERVKSMLLDHWQEAGTIAAAVASNITRSTGVLLGWLASLVLVPVVTFYMLRDWDHIVAGVRDLLPRSIESEVRELTGQADEVLGAFLRGQLLVMASLGIIYSVGLWIAGVELAVLIGLLAGLVSFVPYLGLILGIVVASLAVLFQTQDILQIWPVFLVFGFGQLLEGSVLTPWLVGDRIGVHPIGVIFAVLAGGVLFGFLGVLLALPGAAVLAVLMRRAKQRYQASTLYTEAEAEAEPETAGEGDDSGPGDPRPERG